ncbi:hypothetical protein [Nonomuraea sp. NPDC049480]|uniref:hypothetical protein n=1 Tax=Nonomuraea sp. NPDC049480 TaxID=3364353 RepID=UPI0037876DB1
MRLGGARFSIPDRFVAGLDTVGPQTVRQENTSLLTQMIADLEARLTEPAAG